MATERGPVVGPWKSIDEVGTCNGCQTRTLRRVMEVDVGSIRARLCYRCAKGLCAQLDHQMRRK